MITKNHIESSIKDFAKDSQFTFSIIDTKYRHKFSKTKVILEEIYEVETNNPTTVNEYSKYTGLKFIFYNT